MEHQVFADIEIEGEKIDYYSSVVIRQRFNAHHEFAIRIKYDVLASIGAFSLSTAQNHIGKLAIIKLVEADKLEPSYEFRGLICEVGMEQSENFTSHLVLKGYSPTILLESGPHLDSFYQKDLQQIVQQVSAPAQQSCTVNVAPQYKTQLKYICQYRESGFHFLNRLSADYSEWFYYDGINLNFGKPSSSPEIGIEYGTDVQQLQLKLRLLPLAFKSYSYLAKDDEYVNHKAPSNVDGLDEWAGYALQESHKMFTEPVIMPARQRIESRSDLEGFVKQHKTSLAADLEVLSGSSDNPAICIGAIADVKAATRENNFLGAESYGKFLITAIEHHLTENNRYYNSFEGISAGPETVPVRNTVMPIAEPQIATVMDNTDPDNSGRVRVQMLWQQESGQETDWIRVMTPDAGGGRGGDKNRGLVTIPEVGDQVLVCFRYNDPDRPFVMGSLFHGKSGGGGGGGNKVKSLTALSGSTIKLDGDSIHIIDAPGNSIVFDGAGKIDITTSAKFTITCGGSSITMDSGGKIDIKGTEITIDGSTKAVMKSTAHFTAQGTNATIEGTAVKATGEATVEVGSPSTTVKGDASMKMEGATVDINGSAMTNVKGGIVNLN